MNPKTYSHVQFIGYAIPSIPLSLADIGHGPILVEGRYIGINPAVADIDARIALAMKGVHHAQGSHAVDQSAKTLKIFMMPEFTFRGKRGAYDNAPPIINYFTYFREEFAKCVAGPDYQDWLFVVGTIVNTVDYVRMSGTPQDEKARVREEVAIALADTWQYCEKNNDPELEAFVFSTLKAYTKYCHDHPIYEVTDRSYVVAGGPKAAVYGEGLSVQKKFISNEDFVLNLYMNVFNEESCAYPQVSENKGENKQKPFDDLSIFTIAGIKFGLEICLDHGCSRLRTYREPDTELVQIQLVPSCGMQIQQPSVIAGRGGYVFNCDGQIGEIGKDSQPDANHSIWTGAESTKAHTQLAQVKTPCSRGASGSGLSKSTNAILTKPAATVTKVSMDHVSALNIFAYGPGEVHVYSSLPVPPPVGTLA
jgi:hypothetical protein